MSIIKVNTIQHSSGANAAITLSSNGAVAFANTVSISGKINANNTTTIDNVAVTSTSTNSYISVTSSSGGGQMMMQAFQGTLGTIGSTNNIPVELITNSLRRMYVDTSGYVTKPYQPSVLAVRSNNITSALNPVIFDNIIDQTGNCYNASTGWFTCPVTGWYLLNFSTIIYSMGGSSYAFISKNGSTYGPTSLGTYSTFSGTYAGQAGSQLVKGAAGDTIGVGWYYSTTNAHGGYAAMSVGLIC